MTLEKALEMIAPFSGLPHYETAVAQLYVASVKGKRELRQVASRIRDAFADYSYSVNYGRAEAA